MPKSAIAATPQTKKDSNSNRTNRRDRYTDNQFHADNADDRAAYGWISGIFWPNGPRCMTCWSCAVIQIEPGPVPLYWCRRCEQPFSVVTKTLMEGLTIPLSEWRHALFIITGGPTISTPRQLAERIGWADRTARSVTYRLLQATNEPRVPLREPAELDWTELVHPRAAGCSGHSLVIAVVGRDSKRVAGLRCIPTQHAIHIQRFVDEHVEKGMRVFRDNHASNRWIEEDMLDHGRHQYARGPVCTNLPEGLWPRLKRLLHVDYSWYVDGTLTHWLDGVRWWENHRTLGHRERMAKLAEAMMYRIPRLIADPFREQPELGQLYQRRCTDCRDVRCFAERSTLFGQEQPPRANPYLARQI